MKRTQAAWRGVALVLAGSIFSSSKAVIIKLAYRHGIDASSLLTLRMLIALPFFLGLAFWSWQRTTVRPTPKEWGSLAVVGCLGYYLASLFDFIGLEYITAGLERLIVFAYPTLVVLLGWVIWRRKISAVQWLALVLTYAGILLALTGDVVIPEQRILWTGAFWVFLCALAYALHLLGSEWMLPRLGVMLFSSLAMLFAAAGVLLHALLQPNPVVLTGWPSELYQLAALLTVITTILPPYLMSAGIQRMGAGNAAILGSIGPVSTLVLAWWFLEEKLSVLQLAGAAIVLLGVGLVSYAGRKRKQSPDSEKTRKI